MTYHDFYARLDHEHRTARIERTLRLREGSRARAARLRGRASAPPAR